MVAVVLRLVAVAVSEVVAVTESPARVVVAEMLVITQAVVLALMVAVVVGPVAVTVFEMVLDTESPVKMVMLDMDGAAEMLYLLLGWLLWQTCGRGCV